MLIVGVGGGADWTVIVSSEEARMGALAEVMVVRIVTWVVEREGGERVVVEVGVVVVR